MLAFLITAWNP